MGLAAFVDHRVLVFLLTSSRGSSSKRALRTYMDDASGMADGTPVRLNGITIGSLDKVELTDSTDPKRTVEFDMEVQRKYLSGHPGRLGGGRGRSQPAGR